MMLTPLIQKPHFENDCTRVEGHLANSWVGKAKVYVKREVLRKEVLRHDIIGPITKP